MFPSPVKGDWDPKYGLCGGVYLSVIGFSPAKLSRNEPDGKSVVSKIHTIFVIRKVMVEFFAYKGLKPATKQSKLNFKPKTSAAPKSKKKNPWDTDSEEDDSGGGIGLSSSDGDDDFKPKKKTTARGNSGLSA